MRATDAGGATSLDGAVSTGDGAVATGGVPSTGGAAGSSREASTGGEATAGTVSAGGTSSTGGGTNPGGSGGTTSSGGTSSEARDAAVDSPAVTDTAQDSALADAVDGPSVTTPSILTYTALIVTNNAYADAFQQLAQIHTLTGVPTQVVTVETMCSASSNGCHDDDACNDTSKVIKDYLISRHGQGLQHVVLGGDMSIVPSRQTSDSYSNALFGVAYSKTFYTDYYFADLSQWDSNGNCNYGDPSDSPDYLPELDVTRISVSSPSELQTYIAKVEGYLTAYETTQIDTALFLSNVATQIPLMGTTVPVDSALYFESSGRTLSLMPSDFAITKLYWSPSSGSGASKLTVDSETTAFENGVNLVVHAGHGNESDVTVEYDGTNEFSRTMAYALQNRQYPIILSCACEAATFADGDDCAGQNFITAPQGGGVGYLGNSTIGLGIAGGMQFIDQFLQYAFNTPGAVLVGQAVMAGHANLPTSDSFVFPLFGSVQVVDLNSWRWTQKATTYLGDGLLPIYTNSALTLAPTFSITDQQIGGLLTIAIQPTVAASGTLTVTVAGNIYQFVLTGNGNPVSLTVAGSPTLMWYGFSSSSTLASYQQVTLP